MAEAIVSSIAAGILTKLGSRLLKEIGLLWNVNDELEKLSLTISAIQAVLVDAEEKSMKSNQVKLWLGHLKEVVYEADDLLDDFSTEALRQKVMTGNRISKKVRTFFSLSSNPVVYVARMAHRVRDIGDKLDVIAKSREFHLEERSLEKSVVDRETHSSPPEIVVGHRVRDIGDKLDVIAKSREFHLEERSLEKSVVDRETHSSPPEIVVGREDDKGVIMDYMLSSDCKASVGFISIVGIGGLGKTTLAQSVFSDEKVKEYFELRLWVCVSDNFDVKVIIEKILESITKKKSEKMEINTLKELLHEKIGGKRYLLVLDDVWSDDQEKWSHLNDLLVVSSRGSRIIVTTRLKQVADMTKPILVHEMRGLSEMDSWLLFKKIAFSGDQVHSEDHEKIGKEIVMKCYGVPLAIRAVGGLLSLEQSVAEWQALKDKEIMKIDKVEKGIQPILEISYNHLPSHLKNCFVYCRLFPKDSRIDVSKLVSFWIAQGFVKVSDATECPMDVGFKYFKDLFWRSFFQEVEKDDLGNVSFCKMHDLIHDLAAKLAGVESVMVDSDGDNIDGKTRHASFLPDPNSPWKLPPSLLKAGNLRTFLLPHDKFFQEMEERQLDVIISNFRRLRMLDLHDSNITMVPHFISKLKHLRHLDLSNNWRMELLPDSLTKLQNLLTLNLDGCSSLRRLPRDTQKLVNLTELSLEGCERLTHMPQGMGQLTCLHKLSKFVVVGNNKHASSTLKELGGLNNLRGTLEIIKLGYVRKAIEFQEANLKEKQNLQELKLDWWGLSNFEDVEVMAFEALQPHRNLKGFTMCEYRGSKIPMWLSSLVNLVRLTLRCCDNCEHLPPLLQLFNLKHLHIEALKRLKYIDRGESTSTTLASSFFPSLETLHLLDCVNLKGWWKTKPTPTPIFPCLSQLEIKECGNIISMPLLPPLKFLSFGNGSVMSLKEILNTNTTTATPAEESASSSSPLSSFSLALSQLHKLDISDIQDLESLPEDLAQNLASLKILSISKCNSLKTLSQAVRHLTSLEELRIYNCEELNMFDEGNDDEAMHWQALRSLCSLYLYNIPGLVSFPSWFQHAMPSLHTLYIGQNVNLRCLPEWMGQLPALQYLYIHRCPQLSERCGSNKGADWPNIASIPNIKDNGRVIQQNGHYVLS